MIPLGLEGVERLALGRLVGGAEGATAIMGVRIDSRRVRPGDLFVAVGHGSEFVADALTRGAAAALLPDDAHAALAALARSVRGRGSARVVGITGSAGKTSTKDILAALCRPHARTVASEGGHNNELGLPLTILSTEVDTEIVIAELGMRGLGQIAELCAIARPDIGVITSVGPVHLEQLGTVERVAEAKAELVDALPGGGTAVVPAGVPALVPYLTRRDIELVRFGKGGDAQLVHFEPPHLVADLAGERVELEVPFTSSHQAENTLAALAAYRALGLPLDRAAAGAGAIAFSPWRGEESELPGGVLVINDAYNANPDSMRAALRHARKRAGDRRLVAVLGGMAELGQHAPSLHLEVGREAERAGVSVLVAVGDLARGYLGAPIADGRHVDTAEEAVDRLRELLRPGDVVLVKGSRAFALEGIPEALAKVPA